MGQPKKLRTAHDCRPKPRSALWERYENILMSLVGSHKVKGRSTRKAVTSSQGATVLQCMESSPARQVRRWRQVEEEGHSVDRAGGRSGGSRREDTPYSNTPERWGEDHLEGALHHLCMRPSLGGKGNAPNRQAQSGFLLPAQKRGQPMPHQ